MQLPTYIFFPFYSAASGSFFRSPGREEESARPHAFSLRLHSFSAAQTEKPKRVEGKRKLSWKGTRNRESDSKARLYSTWFYQTEKKEESPESTKLKDLFVENVLLNRGWSQLFSSKRVLPNSKGERNNTYWCDHFEEIGFLPAVHFNIFWWIGGVQWCFLYNDFNHSAPLQRTPEHK